MIERDRIADLDRLADAVIVRLEDGGERYWGLDGKRPLGWSDVGGPVLEIIGVNPAGTEDEPYAYSDEQVEYAEVIWADLLPHIKARWAAFREHQS